MKIKCDYCGQFVDESNATCPNCGANLSAVNRLASSQPKTIEELKQWYQDHNLPPEDVTRFYIGKDIKSPKAFGIYEDSNGDFVVYKNKSTGERAVRYKGSDEGYAVNELYQRLKAEIADQKSHSAAPPKNNNTSYSRPSYSNNYSNSNNKKSNKSWLGRLLLSPWGIVAIIVVIALIVVALDKSPANGYYLYKGAEYYYQNDSWYNYDPDGNTWNKVYDDDELDSTINSDTYSDYRTYDHEGRDFEDSIWYDTGSSDDDDDWDSDSFWDSDYDSWDSDSTDWDSDW